MNKHKLISNAARVLLGLLGLTAISCRFKNGAGTIPPCAYGPPPSTYSIKGVVVNEAGQPINNIAVSCKDFSGEYTISPKTNENGEFSFTSIANEDIKNIDITFVDVDGSANNGTYQTTRKSIEVSEDSDTQVKVVMKPREHIDF